MINNRKSPIQDDYIEKYLAEKELNLTATLDAKTAYADADFVVIAAPTNYDSYVSIIIGYILTLTTIPQGDVIGSAFTSIGLILGQAMSLQKKRMLLITYMDIY